MKPQTAKKLPAVFTCLFLRPGIYVDHYMLDAGKVLFEIAVYALRNRMGGQQGDIPVDSNFQIDIYFVSEQSGVQQIDLLHTGLLFNEIPQLLLKWLAAGSIKHPV